MFCSLHELHLQCMQIYHDWAPPKRECKKYWYFLLLANSDWDKYTYHDKKFLNHNISCGVSERATMFYLNNERHFNFSFTNSFGNNGNCHRSGVTWWYSNISNWRKFTILRNRAKVLVSSEVQFSLMRRTRDEWAILLNSTLTSEKL